jgi:hypothetical protein
VLEKTPDVRGLDLPALDVVSTVKGFGCAAGRGAYAGRDTGGVLDGAKRQRPNGRCDSHKAPNYAARSARLQRVRHRASGDVWLLIVRHDSVGRGLH